MDEAIRILGIDPGTRNVGYGVVEQRGNVVVRLDGGCITAGDGPVSERLVMIYRGLRAVIMRHSPSAAAVETVFTGNNPKTAIAIGEGRGVAVLSAAENGLEVKGYEPALVKRAVAGSGRADKDQVRNMVKVLLNLPELPETDHEADALALAITHLKHARAQAISVSGIGLVRPRKCARRSLPEFVLKQLPPGMAAATRRSGHR